MNANELEYRKDLARELLSANITEEDLEDEPTPVQPLAFAPAAAKGLQLQFPDGFEPKPAPIEPAPGKDDALPRADVLVVTWTVDELDALADVLTAGVARSAWYRYARNFATYAPKIRSGAPASRSKRLGSYFLSRVGNVQVLCFKSELHLNQDGIEQEPFAPGRASLPVRELFHQLIDEIAPRLVITTGTAGAVFPDHTLGDVVVTRAARFRLRKEFRETEFADAAFRSEWDVDPRFFAHAMQQMARFKGRVAEPEFLPPTTNFGPLDHLPKPLQPNDPDIKLDGQQMPAFHPILTTDFFEFGTSKNNLFDHGCAVEMGDAVLGMVVQDRKETGRSAPRWLVVRNCSDPQINGELRAAPARQSLQAMWAVYYYKGFGYWTSVNSALATWAVIAAEAA